MGEMKKHNPMVKHRSMERLVRLGKVEKMLLRGITNQAEIARAFGVSNYTICMDVKKIEKKWREDSPEAKQQRVKRVKQLESILLAAANSWEISRSGDGEERKPGDVCYLEQMRKCLFDIAKLEGLVLDKVDVKGSVEHAHEHKHKLDLSGVSSEVLLEAKGAMERLREAAGANGKVITVESKEGKKDG